MCDEARMYQGQSGSKSSKPLAGDIPSSRYALDEEMGGE